MTNLPPQSELNEMPFPREEQVEDWKHCYEIVNTQLDVYDRIVESGADLSPEIYEEIEDLLLLEEYYAKMLNREPRVSDE